MSAIMLVQKNTITVELCGIAADQWRELYPLRQHSRRVAEYYSHLNELARSSELIELTKNSNIHSSLSQIHVITVEYKSVTILCVVEIGRVVIFWLSKLFRGYSSENTANCPAN